MVRLLQKATDAAASARRQGDALKPGDAAGPREPETEGVPLLTGVGVALDALNKLGGYFRSEFSISNIDIAGDSAQLVAATGGRLLALEGDKPASVIAPAVAVQNISDLKNLLKPLLDTMQQVAQAASVLETEAKATRAAAEGETDAARKAKWTKAAAAYESALPILQQAQTRADEFLGTLSAPDSSGTMLLTKILREKTAYTHLQGDNKLALFVDIRGTAGGAYSKKNLWTFFGDLPFYAMGGVIAAYSLVDPKNGGLAASGVVPVHGGYHKVKRVSAAIGQ